MLEIRPCHIRDARDYVKEHHRHNYQEFCNTLSNNAKCSNGKQSAAKYSKSKQSDPPIQSMSNPYPIQSNESIAAEPPHPRPFGKYENVFLSDEQVAELKNEFPSDWEQRIERLSEYMESSGRKYSNHLATIFLLLAGNSLLLAMTETDCAELPLLAVQFPDTAMMVRHWKFYGAAQMEPSMPVQSCTERFAALDSIWAMTVSLPTL